MVFAPEVRLRLSLFARLGCRFQGPIPGPNLAIDQAWEVDGVLSMLHGSRGSAVLTHGHMTELAPVGYVNLPTDRMLRAASVGRLWGFSWAPTYWRWTPSHRHSMGLPYMPTLTPQTTPM